MTEEPRLHLVTVIEEGSGQTVTARQSYAIADAIIAAGLATTPQEPPDPNEPVREAEPTPSADPAEIVRSVVAAAGYALVPATCRRVVDALAAGRAETPTLSAEDGAVMLSAVRLLRIGKWGPEEAHQLEALAIRLSSTPIGRPVPTEEP